MGHEIKKGILSYLHIFSVLLALESCLCTIKEKKKMLAWCFLQCLHNDFLPHFIILAAGNSMIINNIIYSIEVVQINLYYLKIREEGMLDSD